MKWALGVDEVILFLALFLEVGVPISSGESLFVTGFGMVATAKDRLSLLVAKTWRPSIRFFCVDRSRGKICDRSVDCLQACGKCLVLWDHHCSHLSQKWCVGETLRRLTHPTLAHTFGSADLSCVLMSCHPQCDMLFTSDKCPAMWSLDALKIKNGLHEFIVWIKEIFFWNCLVIGIFPWEFFDFCGHFNNHCAPHFSSIIGFFICINVDCWGEDGVKNFDCPQSTDWCWHQSSSHFLQTSSPMTLQRQTPKCKSQLVLTNLANTGCWFVNNASVMVLTIHLKCLERSQDIFFKNESHWPWPKRQGSSKTKSWLKANCGILANEIPSHTEWVTKLQPWVNKVKIWCWHQRSHNKSLHNEWWCDTPPQLVSMAVHCPHRQTWHFGCTCDTTFQVT